MKKYIKGYEVLEDDGERLLGTVDLIVDLQSRLKGKARRNKRSDKLMIKWLKSHLRSYGIAPNPFKNAVLKQYNIANGREKEWKKLTGNNY